MYNAGVMDWVIIAPIKSVYDQRAAARHNGEDGSWRGVNIPPIVLHNAAARQADMQAMFDGVLENVASPCK